MKRSLWKTLILCSLAASLSSPDLLARGGGGGGGGRGGGGGGGGGHSGGGGGGGGGHPGGGGVGGGHVGGGGGQPGGGHVGGGQPGGGHAGGGQPAGGHVGGGQPAGGQFGGGQFNGGHPNGAVGSPHFNGGPSRPMSGGGQPANINRSPTFSPHTGGQFQGLNGRPGGFRPGMGAAGIQAGGAQLGGNGHHNGGFAEQGRLGTGPGFSGSGRAPFANGQTNGFGGRSLGGNTVNVNNHQFNLANSGYQPSYNRHPQYRGYWNGNYGGGYGGGYGIGGFGPGLGLGLGAGLGYGLLSSGYGGYGWGGGYGGYGGYGYRPLGWGLGSWGLGSMAYNSGYLGYSNPYYVNSYPSYGSYSYAQPIPVSYSSDTIVSAADPGVSTTSTTSTCTQSLDDAVAAFKLNNYDKSLDIINPGLVLCPDDAVMHEFRALVLFAKGDYQQAASTIHAVLAVGPGWNWTTLSSLYPDVAVYTAQLRSLEGYARQNPQDGASHFLLAYHYMADGFPDAAEKQLQQVVKLVPNDRVAADVLRMVTKPPADKPAGAVETPSPQPPLDAAPAAATSAPAVKPIDLAKLTGTWQASREDGSRFELTLTKESSFNWKFTLKDTVQEFGGTYTVDGNVLSLQRKDGGSLIAGVVPDGDQKFNFKLLGAPQEDPGLNFSR